MGSDAVGFAATLLLCISIHAPRIGSDCPVLVARYQVTDFNPRSPWGGATEPQFIIDSYIGIFQSTLSVGGERPKKIHNRGDDSGFQSTLPTWGATDIGKRADTVRNISIHAPHMGSDIIKLMVFQKPIFQSTLPAWGATLQWEYLRELMDFNPRSPQGERPCSGNIFESLWISIHAPRMGSDLRESGEITPK